MSQKAIKILAAAVLIIGVGSYFLFYVPYENQFAYQQNLECSKLVTQTETSDEVKITQVLGSTGLIFSTPQSHFNKVLNTCIGVFSFNISNYSKTAGYIEFSLSIVDVVSGKTILSSDTSMTTSKGVNNSTTLNSGVSQDAFKQQEAVLMSE